MKGADCSRKQFIQAVFNPNIVRIDCRNKPVEDIAEIAAALRRPTECQRPEEDAISKSRSQARMIQWLNHKRINLILLLVLFLVPILFFQQKLASFSTSLTSNDIQFDYCTFTESESVLKQCSTSSVCDKSGAFRDLCLSSGKIFSRAGRTKYCPTWSSFAEWREGLILKLLVVYGNWDRKLGM